MSEESHAFCKGQLYDIAEGETVTLPDGTKVTVIHVDHDDLGTFFTCIEGGEKVWYYTDVLDRHPDNAELRDGDPNVCAKCGDTAEGSMHSVQPVQG